MLWSPSYTARDVPDWALANLDQVEDSHSLPEVEARFARKHLASPHRLATYQPTFSASSTMIPAGPRT
jgi:hypothetical protein